jgi:hypothetical protein
MEYESDSRKGDPNSEMVKRDTKYFINLIRADERVAPKFKGRSIDDRTMDRAKRKGRKA